ncbi:MAG: VWA domain-containing protein [Armatimonadetes bacterium]|nr:VWA domain-containing protein [Armatimonadota bacterium]
MDRTQLTPQGEPTRLVGGAKTVMAGTPGGLTLECVSGSRYAYSREDSHAHALAVIRSADTAMAARMPLNLCLVIDRSGSMEGEPLDYVKRAAGHVVDLLEPTDVLSIVTFAEQVDVVMPARRVLNKSLIKDHIQRIQTGNTTNLYDGLVVGGQQVASIPSQTYLNRVLLLTDGEPTAGIRDFASIVGLVAEQKVDGITVTALGFGPEYNEELMAGIARRSAGNYYHISRPELIPEVFRRELEMLLNITARNLRLELSLPRWTQVRQVYGLYPVFGQRTASVNLVDLERGATLAALFELELGARPSGTYRVARADLTYENCVTGKSEHLSGDLAYEFAPDASLVGAHLNPVVERERQIALASRNLEQTMMGLKTQQLASGTALRQLEQTKTILLAQNRPEAAAQLDEAIQGLQGSGAEVEKTLIGAIFSLDTGKRE